MKKYVAFLRAINVAGHASVKMSKLRATFQRAGGSEVRTLIQSGNVLFEAPAREAAGVVRRVVGDDPFESVPRPDFRHVPARCGFATGVYPR